VRKAIVPAILGLGLAVQASLLAQQPELRQTIRGHTKAVRFVAFSPDGKLLASGSMDKTVRLWDVTTGREKALLRSDDDRVFALVGRQG
jgi:WD40 repeat protein